MPFDSLVYDIGIRQLIDDGYLSKLSAKDGGVPNLDDVHVRQGEYIASELEAVMADEVIVERSVKEILRYGENRRSGIIFSSGSKHAKMIHDEFLKHNIFAPIVESKMDSAKRDEYIKAHKEYGIKYIININILSVGYDNPGVDLLALMRPTLSPGLYYQQVGRGLRIADGKQNCIAEGTLILTDFGLVPIEHVTTNMLIWDGTCYVSHGGVAFSGEQETITYDGLTATPDHLVFTEKGWTTFGECFEKQIGISITERDGIPISQANGYFSKHSSCSKSSTRTSSMSDMSRNKSSGIYVFKIRACGMSCLRKSKVGSEMAVSKGDESENEVSKPTRRSIRAIRRARNRVPISICIGGGAVDSGESRSSSGIGIRSYKQQRTLRAWKYSICNKTGKPLSYKKIKGGSSNSQIQTRSSRDTVCRLNIEQNDVSYVGRRNNHSIPSDILQTKRRVWDILNCGPRNCFTAAGRLVHNCIVLDMAGNVATHGPIDTLNDRIKAKIKSGKPGKAPTKTCESCQEIVAAGCRTCPACGAAFPELKVAKHDAEARLDSPISSSEIKELAVVRWTVRLQESRTAGKSSTICVTYWNGLNSVSEWLSVDKTSHHFARQKALQWIHENPCNASPDGRLEVRAGTIYFVNDQGEVKIDSATACAPLAQACFVKPVSIRYQTPPDGSKYPRVLSRNYTDASSTQ
jgi:predicted RNA-binding protein with PUA domain